MDTLIKIVCSVLALLISLAVMFGWLVMSAGGIEWGTSDSLVVVVWIGLCTIVFAIPLMITTVEVYENYKSK